MDATVMLERLGALVPVLAEATWKGSVLLVALLGLARLIRRAPAATRHLLWSAGLVALVALPFLGASLPWRLEVLPSAPVPAAGVDARGAEASPPEAAGPLAQLLPPGGGALTPSEGKATRRGETLGGTGLVREDAAAAYVAVSAGVLPGWAATLALVWALGLALVGLRLAAGWVVAGVIVRRASPLVDDTWAGELLRAGERVGLARPVRLLRSDRVTVAFTTGLLRPVVVLPAECERWTPARRRAVLMHELAHIRRGDLGTHLLGRAACAIHWFNPLAWLAAKRLRAESERACDDMVLSLGTRASEYAGHLLDLVRSAGRLRAPAVVVPMAQESEFEGRLLAILEPGVRRHRPSRLTAVAIVAAVVVSAVPLAAMAPRPAGPAEEAVGAPLPAAEEPAAPEPAAESGAADAEPTELATPEGSDRGPTTIASIPLMAEAPDPRLGQQRPGASVVSALRRALTDPDAGVREAAVRALAEQQDTAAVAALMRALLEDESAEVRETAAWSLGQLESARAVPALSRAVAEDAAPGVRTQAAWALGQIESPSGVPALVRALGDQSAEVRRQVAWALGQIEDASAVTGLMGALDDPDPEVRRQAVWALGQIEDPRALDGLMPLVADRDGDVRSLAVWALAQIEDPRAAPALARALGDSVVDVRVQAAAGLGDMGLQRAPEALMAAARDPSPEVRKMVAAALAEIQDPASVPALTALLKDESAEVRRHALHALGEIGSDAAIQAMVEALSDADAEVRREAARALGRVGGEV